MISSIYKGRISHERFSPRAHRFSYRASMLYIDLDELTSISQKIPFFSSTKKWFPVSFCRSDYFKAQKNDLKQAIHDEVKKSLSTDDLGPVRLLTQPRYWGFCFNPVSFYYIYNRSDTKLVAILAEITNTPWSERHHYTLAWSQQQEDKKQTWAFSKQFHVSPFMPMDIRYEWALNYPDQSIEIHMQNKQTEKINFQAHLRLERESLSASSLLKNLILYPWMTLKIFTAIYWNALLLKLKGTPFYEHPKYSVSTR